MVNAISLGSSYWESSTWVGVGFVTIEPVVDASRSFALTSWADKGEKKAGDAFFELKAWRNVDEVIKNGRENPKLFEEAELLGLAAFGDVLETRIGEESGFESGVHGSVKRIRERTWEILRLPSQT